MSKQSIINIGSNNKNLQINNVNNSQLFIDSKDFSLKEINIPNFISPSFGDHSPEISHVLNYYDWHADNNDLVNGSDGRNLVFCFREHELWYNNFENFEANNYNFITRHGGVSSRLFVVPRNLTNQNERRNFIKLLLRHYLLDLDSRVIFRKLPK